MALDAVPYTVVGPRTIAVVVPVGDGCTPAGSADVEVAETATSVTVRASVRRAPAPAQDGPPDATCPAVLRSVPVSVELSAPLGTRTVVDGVGERVVPPGAWPGLAGEQVGRSGPPVPLLRARDALADLVGDQGPAWSVRSEPGG